MEPIRGTIIEENGWVIDGVNMFTGLANTLNLLVGGNHRPAYITQFELEHLRGWQAAGMRRVLSPRDADTYEAILQLPADKTSINNAPPTRQIFGTDLAPILSRLMADSIYVADLGLNFGAELSATSFFDIRWVAAPSLGYSRPYMQFKPMEMSPSVEFLGDAAATSGVRRAMDEETALLRKRYHDMCADVCMLFDRPSYGMRLLPTVDKLAGRDAKEPLVGQTLAAVRQSQILASVGVLYRLQGTLFWLRCEEQFMEMSFQLASIHFPKERPILNMFRQLIQDAMNAAPLHPLLATVANYYRDVSMLTRYGEHKAHLRHSDHPENGVTVLRDVSTSHAPTAARVYLAGALAEFAQLRDVQSSGAGWAGTYLDSVAGVAVDGSAQFPTLSTFAPYSALLRWTALYHRITQHWKAVATVLGWSAGIASRRIEVSAKGADYIATDGDRYSDDPIAVVAGLRPCIATNNPKTFRIDPELDRDFNGGPSIETDPDANDGGLDRTVRIKWSTVTFAGHVTKESKFEPESRFIIPIAMSMGATGATIRVFDDSIRDELGALVSAFYRDRSPNGYVSQFAVSPAQQESRIDAQGAYMRTDWEAAVEGGDMASTQSKLLAAYGPDNVDRKTTVFLSRAEWPLRAPMMIARDHTFEWLDARGMFGTTVRFNGALLYSGPVTLSVSSASIQAVVDLLPIGADPGSEETEAPITDHVTHPAHIEQGLSKGAA